MNRYFYIDAEGKQKGTFLPEELKREGIKRDTLVWTQGMEQWKRAGETEELRFLFFDTYDKTQPVTPYGRPAETAGLQGQQPMPKTWLVESILATILPFMFCCNLLSLLGIIGIVYASQVESFYNRGDYAASLESSRSAGRWTKIAMWIAIGWIVLLVVFTVLVIALAGSASGLGFMNDLLDT